MIFSSGSRLLAVADGEAKPLVEVPEGMVPSGAEISGYAVEPISGTIYSPVSGRIERVTESRQSYSIRAEDGLDVHVHIGIDKMDLGGRGVISLVDKGDSVRAGDIIAKADLALIKLSGYSATTPVVISGGDTIKACEVKFGWVRGGRSAVMKYKKQ